MHEAGGGARWLVSAERQEARIGAENTLSWTVWNMLRRGMAGCL
jgi:hypothetical protein